MITISERWKLEMQTTEAVSHKGNCALIRGCTPYEEVRAAPPWFQLRLNTGSAMWTKTWLIANEVNLINWWTQKLQFRSHTFTCWASNRKAIGDLRFARLHWLVGNQQIGSTVCWSGALQLLLKMARITCAGKVNNSHESAIHLQTNRLVAWLSGDWALRSDCSIFFQSDFQAVISTGSYLVHEPDPIRMGDSRFEFEWPPP